MYLIQFKQLFSVYELHNIQQYAYTHGHARYVLNSLLNITSLFMQDL